MFAEDHPCQLGLGRTFQSRTQRCVTFDHENIFEHLILNFDGLLEEQLSCINPEACVLKRV